jgi:hypothetical protein
VDLFVVAYLAFEFRASNMEIRFCWYQDKNVSVWTYDLRDHLMVELDAIIALATMTYIVETTFA